MRILLVGASGAMGQSVVRFVEQTTDQVTVALQDKESNEERYEVFTTFEAMSQYLTENPEAADVIIDFSSPKITDDVLKIAEKHQTPLMLATTGQTEEQEQLIKAAAKNVAIVDTHNTSIGVNVMQALVAQMTKMLYPLGYDIEVIEKHHRYKKDSPSGTAKMILKAAQDSIDESTTVLNGRDGVDYQRPHSEIGVHAIRGGDIVGEHTILFANNQETLELTHRAGTKDLFVRGALQAARFLVNAEPGLYDMHDVIG
ncbi:4-hydroxy-tetrahydrodipicolinate reductase [Aerococcaceae bacterium DSM 109653]|uniref:4-hydroxy-tetrahydrodipicolinate reductase n=1 Tax=Fundicoccus ignavus TaxID=2664442 RepID=A0A844BY74_9LACT|nr:4-hydroxy-tetrahydrodipicolinate reductase [Fundicoccus ignavus]MRI81416.1 4-hydroxy-tetrahydrodipicolinate reductase [Fundicoccus ignavus]